MKPLALLLSLTSLAAQEPAARRGQDVLELKNGDQLVGRITQQVDGYVEIQLEAGAVVGVSTAQVAAIRRDAALSVVPVASPVPSRNEWFVLFDGHGASVGWLNASVVPAMDGSLSIREEYEFVDGLRRYQVTSLCHADAQLRPLSCYFRERIGEPNPGLALVPGTPGVTSPDRIVDERIVEATCRGDVLQVVRLDRNGRRERQLSWTPDTTFPLLARVVARQHAGTVKANRMFDPATEDVVVRTLTGPRQRHVLWNGKQQSVTEIVESSASGHNSEWLDASSQTLRREIAGPSLTAVPSSVDSARNVVGKVSIASSLVAESTGSFGLWVPNPAWRAVEGVPPGQVALVEEAHGASIGLSQMDHLEASATIETAADAVANWVLLLHPDMAVRRREAIVVRERQAIRLWASGKTSQATVDIIPQQGRHLVLVCRAPTAAWEELEPDFAFVLRSIELRAQSMTPVLQGPIAERDLRQAKARREVGELVPRSEAVAGKATPPAPAVEKRPLVRIVNDR